MEDTTPQDSQPADDQRSTNPPAGDQSSTPPAEDQGAPQAAKPPAGDQGAAPPQAAQPPAGQTGDQGAKPPAGQAGDKKNLSGIMEENVDISALVANAGNQQQQDDFISSVKIPAHPNTKFDDQKFLKLLAGSISLTINEKKRIIEAIPQLSQFQIDELMKIFEEEQTKFSELEKKHSDQVADLEKQHKESWQDLEAKKEEETKKEEESKEAEDSKKSLGL